MSPAVNDLYRFAWRHVHALPTPVGYGLFAAGTAGSVLIRTTGADGLVVADAARFVPA